MATEAHATFSKNIKRPHALVEMFEAGSLDPQPGQRRNDDTPSWRENELLRAAVIITIGALDAYLSDVAAEVLVAQLSKASPANEASRAVLRRVMEEIKTLPIELALIEDGSERREVAAAALHDHLSNHVSNHGTRGVNATVDRMGLKLDWDDLDEVVTPALRLPKTKHHARALLDGWTHRRHELVHHGRVFKIKSASARALAEFVEHLAGAVDELAVEAKGAD